MTWIKTSGAATLLILACFLADAPQGRAQDEWGGLDDGYQAEEYFPEEFSDDYADEAGEAPPLDLESANTSLKEAENQFERQRYSTAAELAALAATHFGSLAQTDPDLYRPRQMAGLVLQIRSLRKFGELDEAKKAADALAARLKPLAAKQEAIYLPYLAEASHELAEILYDRREPPSRAPRILDHRRTAAAAWRDLSLKEPDKYWEAWEEELELMLLDSREFGLDGEKQKILTELIRASRWMAGERPETHRPVLAENLVAHGEELALMGQSAAGRAAIEDGIKVYRQLEQESPGEYARKLSEAEYILTTLP